jgi:Protein of unknown function (DUF4231)
MSENSKSETLARLLEEQISSFDRRRKRDKDKALVARMVQALASASITVLLGLNISKLGGSELLQEWLKAVALVISATATLFAAWDAFFDHRELWIRYAAAASTLRGLRSELQYVTSSGSAPSEADLDRLFRQCQETLEKINTSWQQLRASPLKVQPQDSAVKS